jgi:co-chaperonin GroES (HSP10)
MSMNKSGIHPVEYKVLILPVKVEEKTSGGIILTDESKNREKHSIVKGLLVAVGANAFTDPDWGYRPKPGQMVMFDRHAGDFVIGDDGEEYRLSNDKEIKAVLGDYNG